MIRRLRATNFKSLSDLEVRFQPLTVLIGPNAAGKSNILDAIQLLSRLVTSRTIKEAFDPPYRGAPIESFTFGQGGIAGHLEKSTLEFTLEADIELSDATVYAVEQQIAEMRKGASANGEPEHRRYIKERLLRYSLTIGMSPKSGFLRVIDESLSAIRQNGERKESRNPFLERVEGHRLSLRLEGQAHPTYHEVGLDHTIASRPLYPPHYPHLAALRKELEGWLCFYFEPRERMRAPNTIKEVNHIGLMGENLAAFLNTLRAKSPARLRAIEKSLHMLIPRISGVEVEPNTLGEVELRLREDGTAIPSRLASEGTLRVLGMLAIGVAGDAASMVALEEPENGVHPRRIALIARFLTSQAEAGLTQYIVTSHSPILADLIDASSLYVVRRRDSRTTVEPFPEAGLFRREELAEGLSDQDDELVSERIMRGDFDA